MTHPVLTTTNAADLVTADERSARITKALGVTTTQRIALLRLYALGTRDLTDVASHIPLSRSAMTTLADTLETTGLAKREHGKDRRRTYLALTETGRRRVASALRSAAG